MQGYGFSLTAFSRITTESNILPFCGRIMASENLHSRIFYAVLAITAVTLLLLQFNP